MLDRLIPLEWQAAVYALSLVVTGLTSLGSVIGWVWFLRILRQDVRTLKIQMSTRAATLDLRRVEHDVRRLERRVGDVATENAAQAGSLQVLSERTVETQATVKQILQAIVALGLNQFEPWMEKYKEAVKADKRRLLEDQG